MACSAESTPTPAAAVISPTEWPAATPMKGKASAGCGKQFERGQQAGGDEQRLGDGGVPDRLGVGLGAVVPQVERRRQRRTSQAVGEGLLGQPRSQEAGVCAP